MGSGRAEIVAGDADEPGQPLVPGGQDRLGGADPLVEDVEPGDAVQLVEVEGVGAEDRERLLELGPHAVRVLPLRLAADEQPLAHGRQERPEVGLGPAVRGGDVEVVHAPVEGELEAGLGLLR